MADYKRTPCTKSSRCGLQHFYTGPNHSRTRPSSRNMAWAHRLLRNSPGNGQISMFLTKLDDKPVDLDPIWCPDPDHQQKTRPDGRRERWNGTERSRPAAFVSSAMISM
jgi:hypothetical protein